MATKYKLHYFNGMWMGEPIRLMFALKNVAYEDVRYEENQWAAVKPTMPWGKVPLLEVNGDKLSQGDALYRFVGRKLGLNGDTEIEIAKCDEYVHAIGSEVRSEITKQFDEKDEKRKEEIKKNILEKTLPEIFGEFEKILEKNGTGFLVGKKLTYADIVVAHNVFLPMLVVPAPNALDKFPKLKKHQEMVFSQPGIKEWVAKRPKTPY